MRACRGLACLVFACVHRGSSCSGPRVRRPPLRRRPAPRRARARSARPDPCAGRCRRQLPPSSRLISFLCFAPFPCASVILCSAAWDFGPVPHLGRFLPKVGGASAPPSFCPGSPPGAGASATGGCRRGDVQSAPTGLGPKTATLGRSGFEHVLDGAGCVGDHGLGVGRVLHDAVPNRGVRIAQRPEASALPLAAAVAALSRHHVSHAGPSGAVIAPLPGVYDGPDGRRPSLVLARRPRRDLPRRPRPAVIAPARTALPECEPGPVGGRPPGLPAARRRRSHLPRRCWGGR